MKARTSRTPPTAAADPLAVAGRTPSGQLDVASATPSLTFSPCGPPQRRLDALATDGHGKSGLTHNCELLILGIGNLLWADEGFGVRAVEALHRRYELPDGVTVMDGGTQGLYLLPYVQGARRLLIFDAIDYGLEPGTLKQVRDDEVPRFTGAKKMSLHQTGFQDVLSAADLLGGLPEAMLLIGVQAEQLDDWGGTLSACVSAQIEPAVAAAAAQLAEWGIPLQPREAPLAAAQEVLRHGLDRQGYEWRPAGREIGSAGVRS